MSDLKSQRHAKDVEFQYEAGNTLNVSGHGQSIPGLKILCSVQLGRIRNPEFASGTITGQF